MNGHAESEDSLRSKLVHLNWLQHRKFAQEIADLNLTVPQFYTLSTLVDLGGQSTMGRLARSTRQVSATMTGIIDRLVRDGLVARQRDENDRRTVIVAITDEGREIVDSAWKRALGDINTIVDQLDAGEQDVANRFLDSLVSNLQQ